MSPQRSILDEFEHKTIEVWEGDRLSHVPAWTYGELFAVQTSYSGVPHWCIGCIPLQAMFPPRIAGIFVSIENAAGMIKDLAKLCNSWGIMETFSVELTASILLLSDKHQGIRNVHTPPTQDAYVPEHHLRAARERLLR